jgi:hypothetical protein
MDTSSELVIINPIILPTIINNEMFIQYVSNHQSSVFIININVYECNYFKFINYEQEEELEELFHESDNNDIITKQQQITPQLISIMKQYCGIIFINYENIITNLPSNIKYIAVIGKYSYDYNSLHNGLLLLYIEGYNRNNTYYNCTSKFDNMPVTLKILRFDVINILNKINYFGEDFNEITFFKYEHPINNLNAKLKFLSLNDNYGEISNIPLNLIYFNSSDANNNYNVKTLFADGLKIFSNNGDMLIEDFNSLPDSVEIVHINREFNMPSDNIKYSKNLKSLYLEEYGLIDFDSISDKLDKLEVLQVGKSYLYLVNPDKLPKSLRYFIILDNSEFHYAQSDNDSTDTDDTDYSEESIADITDDHPIKRTRLLDPNETSNQTSNETRLERIERILIHKMLAKGIKISYNQ